MELVPEDPDFKVPFLTGYFRDQKRRIDMVLVSKDTGKDELETMKMTFLMNAINMGFDVEIEAGNEKYADLNFIKLHVTEKVLHYFGLYYNIKKVFKASHLKLIRCGIFEEKQMVKMIRRWYPTKMFSTFERSQIANKMLTSVSFGHPENYVGIHQLIDNKIFLDMFPLHDGPVHLVRGQTPLQLNGRQALFYNWCGYENLFRLMPLNIIREYLGERIGFFFAFYQFYNCFMFLLGMLGIYIYSKNFDIKDRIFNVSPKNLFFSDHCEMCPKCRDWVACPMKALSSYKNELLLKIHLSNPYAYFMAFATVVWGMLLHLLWRRFENYWYWMWEVNEDDARSLTRPEFRKVGRTWNWQVVFRRPIELAILVAAIIAIVILYPGLMLEVNLKMMNRLRYVEEYSCLNVSNKIGLNCLQFPERLNHFAIVIIGSMNAIFIMSLERGWFFVGKFLNWAYEPRSEWQYEQRFIHNTFGIIALMNFAVVSFYAHVKGAFFIHLLEEEHWFYPLQLGMLNCGALGCIDEVFLIYVSTFKTKMFYQQIMRTLTCLPTDKQKDPDKFVPTKYDHTPCWEREMKLLPVNEDFIFDLYLKLFIQIAIVTFFASVFPLAPIIASVWNLWNMGYLAKLLVVHGRRPLLLQTWGIGPWHQILFFMPFITCFTNAIYVVRNMFFLDWKFYQRYWGHELQQDRYVQHIFPSYYLTSAQFSTLMATKIYNVDYEKNFKTTQRIHCHTGAQYYLYDQRYLVPAPARWAIPWRQTLFILLFWWLSMVFYFLLKHFIAPVSFKVREMRRAEEAVKQYGMKKIPRIKVKKPDPAITKTKTKTKPKSKAKVKKE